jgi:acetyltransferase
VTIRNLNALLHPRSIALIGGSSKQGSLGAKVLENVVDGGFKGPIYAVNPHPVEAAGVTWTSSIDQLPEAPDLAIVMTPARTIPAIIADLGARGTKCAVVISAGNAAADGLRQEMLDAARPHLLRVIGPNCLGVMAPLAGLNATFARTSARPGRLALISQSGALVTAILDWADTRGIGFSGIVSVGDMADVDVGDLIDLFAVDPATDAILMYVEGITDAAKFMSAARAAARIKPVIAIKAGRSAQAAKATLSHTGALAGSYEVYRTAFDRAGIVTVDTLTELFDAAEILCRYRQPSGNSLGIVTNGGGAGILAVDALLNVDARLADISSDTLTALDTALPVTWSHGNPVDVIGDATPERYRAAIGPVLRDAGVDALLVMNCPTATTQAVEIAHAIAEEVRLARQAGLAKPVIACWLGDANAAAVRNIMNAADIPTYGTPDDALRGFGYLLAAQHARSALIDGPAARHDVISAVPAAQAIIDRVRADKRTVLTEIEAKALLQAYHIPTVPTRFAPSVEAIDDACGFFPPPYAIKIVSPDISHKSDVGGVALNLSDRKAASAAACAMGARIVRDHPDARLFGYAVEAMCERPHAHELIVGIATDPTFGPVLMVGAGGTGVELIADKALALAPIDHSQATAMIARTRIYKLLAGYRHEPPADLEGVAVVLDALSAMAQDLPDIVELDINPLLVDAQGVVALDARIRITEFAHPKSRLVIRPAPMEWSADFVTRTGMRLHVRPVLGDDEPLLAAFFQHVTPEDLRFRFLSGLVTVDHDRLTMMTKVDYRRTISFLAFGEDPGTIVATAMLAADADRTKAEVALTTRADMKGTGISWTLFEHVMRYAQAEGIGTVEAIECADHDAAIRMEREMGFIARTDPDDPTMRIVRRVFEPVDGTCAS